MFSAELKELNLTENESNVYLLLLKQGPLSPSDIAAHLGLHRGYVYDSLERMKEKGVIKILQRNNKKIIHAKKPSEIAAILKEKLDTFKGIVPKLEALAKKEETIAKVEHQMNENLKNCLEKSAKEVGKEIDIIGLPMECEKIFEKNKKRIIYAKKTKEIIQVIGKEKTILIIPGENVQTITIENDAVAQTYKKQFDLLWRMQE